MLNITPLTKTNTTPVGPSSFSQASPLRNCLCEYLLTILHFSANRSPTWSFVSQGTTNKFQETNMIVHACLQWKIIIIYKEKKTSSLNSTGSSLVENFRLDSPNKNMELRTNHTQNLLEISNYKYVRNRFPAIRLIKLILKDTSERAKFYSEE